MKNNEDYINDNNKDLLFNVPSITHHKKYKQSTKNITGQIVTDIHRHTHTRNTHTFTHTHTQHSHIHSHTHATLTHSLTHTQHSHTKTHTHTQHSHIHSHTHTHTHRRACALINYMSFTYALFVL